LVKKKDPLVKLRQAEFELVDNYHREMENEKEKERNKQEKLRKKKVGFSEIHFEKKDADKSTSSEKTGKGNASSSSDTDMFPDTPHPHSLTQAHMYIMKRMHNNNMHNYSLTPQESALTVLPHRHALAITCMCEVPVRDSKGNIFLAVGSLESHISFYELPSFTAVGQLKNLTSAPVCMCCADVPSPFTAAAADELSPQLNPAQYVNPRFLQESGVLGSGNCLFWGGGGRGVNEWECVCGWVDVYVCV
jgi:hypothetical protein